MDTRLRRRWFVCATFAWVSATPLTPRWTADVFLLRAEAKVPPPPNRADGAEATEDGARTRGNCKGTKDVTRKPTRVDSVHTIGDIMRAFYSASEYSSDEDSESWTRTTTDHHHKKKKIHYKKDKIFPRIIPREGERRGMIRGWEVGVRG